MMNGSIPGQSVLTPSGGTGWNNITFNWYDPLSTPYADGTLYILTQEYDRILSKYVEFAR